MTSRSAREAPRLDSRRSLIQRTSERRRSRLALSPLEREEISRGIAADRSMRKIASSIQRAPSTVSREIARNGGRKRYRASEADQGAWGRARRPKPCRLALSRRLQRIVAKKLSLEWSPEQISGWLKRSYPEDEEMQISHETIYRSLFVQARGVLKKELVGHLRTRRMMRRSKKASTRGQPRGQIVDAVSIQIGLPRSRTAQSRATGRETSWPARTTRTLRRWSSGSRASRCW